MSKTGTGGLLDACSTRSPRRTSVPEPLCVNSSFASSSGRVIETDDDSGSASSSCLICSIFTRMPQIVTLSYHDAGRWLDAQETVERVDAPPEVLMWLQAFIDAHYQPEPKRRRRPDSFRPLTDRFGNPVSISTDKTRRGLPADAASAQRNPADQTGKPAHGH